MRRRLIELLQTVPTDPEGNRNVGVIADYLLENGVVVWNNELKCGELIELKSESEALNRIALQLEVLNRMNSDFNYYEHCLRIAKKSTEEQQTEIKKDNGWISVKDRLPEDDLPNNKKQIKVLVVIKAKNGYTVRSQMRFLDIYNKWAWKYSAGDITHWMPLPELPNFENECEIVGNVHDNPDLLEESE